MGIAKLKKPIEKCDSLTLPPRTPKKKGNKKEQTSGSSTSVTNSKLNRSESLSLAANHPLNASNINLEHFQNISQPIKKETLHKLSESDINSETDLISGVIKKEGNDSITLTPLWSKLKGLSTGTLKRSKKRNRSENSTSS